MTQIKKAARRKPARKPTAKTVRKPAAPKRARKPAGILARRPWLAPGAFGPDVTELAGLLAARGYRTPQAAGGAPVFDQELVDAVRAARAKLDVHEEPVFGEDTDDRVGPALWAALGEAA